MTPAAPPARYTDFHVTDHALKRWRERVAEYANDPASSLLDALQKSAPAGPTDPLPPGLALLPGQRYRVMKDRPFVIFITEPRADDFEMVVTVLDLEVRPLPPPKARPRKPPQDSPAPAEGYDVPLNLRKTDVATEHQFMTFACPADEGRWLRTREAQLVDLCAELPHGHPLRKVWYEQLKWLRRKATQTTPAAVTPLKDEHALLTFETPGHEREWLRGKWKALTQAATGMTKSHPDRPSVVAQLSWLTGRMQEQKLAYKAWKVAESRRLGEEGGVYQENGELNQSAALHHLLKEVARLSAEVEALKKLSPQFLPVTARE